MAPRSGPIPPFASRTFEVGPIKVEQVSHAPASHGSFTSPEAHVLQLHLGRPMWCRLQQAGERSEHTYQRGHMTLVPAGVEVSCQRDTSASFARLHLARSACTAVGVDELVPERARHRFHDPLLRELTLAVVERVASEGEASRCYAESAAHLIALHLAHRRQPTPRSAERGIAPSSLRRVLARLHDALDQSPSVSELAEIAELDVAHFSRMFKRSTGLAPHQYLQRLRLERAQQLVTTSRQSMLQIALALGFSNPSHFAAFYRKHTGKTPSAHRHQSAQALR